MISIQVFHKMLAEKDLAKRRKMTLKIVLPTIVEVMPDYRVRCVMFGEYYDGDSRTDLMGSHLIDLCEKPCQWANIWNEIVKQD